MTARPVARLVRRAAPPLRTPMPPARPAPGDDELVAAARTGDRVAWDLLVRRHQGFAFRCAFLLGRDAENAEESTFSAMVRAFRGLDSLGPDIGIRPHLMRVVAGVTRTRSRELAQRRDARPIERQPIPRLPADPLTPSAARTMTTPMEHDALVAAYDRLGDDDRVVIASRYAFGLSRAEIAAYLGLLDADIDERLRSALGRFRQYLADAPSGDPSPGAVADPGRYRVSDLPVGHFASLADDPLGAMAVRAVFSAVPWKPDLAPMVAERLAREAMAYPERSAVAPGNGPGAGDGNERAWNDRTGHARSGRQAAVSPRTGRSSSVRPMMAAVGMVVVVGVLATSAYIGERDGPLPRFLGGPGGGLPTESALAGTTTDAVAALAGPVESLAPDRLDAADTARAGRPAWTIVEARPVRGDVIGARVALDWPVGPDFIDDATHTLLQRRLGGGWREVASAEAGRPVDVTLAPGKRYELRVRSLDADGDVLDSQRLRVRLAVRAWDSPRIDRTRGHWKITNGGALASTSDDAGITTSFEGDSVALIAPTGPAGGSMRVRVDEGDWVRGEIEDPVPTDRSVVFSQDLEAGSHSLEVGVNEGIITLDSMMIVRSSDLGPEAY